MISIPIIPGLEQILNDLDGVLDYCTDDKEAQDFKWWCIENGAEFALADDPVVAFYAARERLLADPQINHVYARAMRVSEWLKKLRPEK